MKFAELLTAALGECLSAVLPSRKHLGGCVINSDTLLHKLYIIAREYIIVTSAFMTSTTLE